MFLFPAFGLCSQGLRMCYSVQLRCTQISMYINSPGGVVTAGMAVYDTMQVNESCVQGATL